MHVFRKLRRPGQLSPFDPFGQRVICLLCAILIAAVVQFFLVLWGQWRFPWQSAAILGLGFSTSYLLLSVVYEKNSIRKREDEEKQKTHWEKEGVYKRDLAQCTQEMREYAFEGTSIEMETYCHHSIDATLEDGNLTITQEDGPRTTKLVISFKFNGKVFTVTRFESEVSWPGKTNMRFVVKFPKLMLTEVTWPPTAHRVNFGNEVVIEEVSTDAVAPIQEDCLVG